jgi:hypothetical protein
MLTPEDIKNLTEYQKEIFVTKEDLVKVLDEKLLPLQRSVDAIANGLKSQGDEIYVVNHRLEKTEDWIEEAAPKVGIKFDR